MTHCGDADGECVVGRVEERAPSWPRVACAADDRDALEGELSHLGAKRRVGPVGAADGQVDQVDAPVSSKVKGVQEPRSARSLHAITSTTTTLGVAARRR